MFILLLIVVFLIAVAVSAVVVGLFDKSIKQILSQIGLLRICVDCLCGCSCFGDQEDQVGGLMVRSAERFTRRG
jgi:hypothetical protein